MSERLSTDYTHTQLNKIYILCDVEDQNTLAFYPQNVLLYWP